MQSSNPPDFGACQMWFIPRHCLQLIAGAYGWYSRWRAQGNLFRRGGLLNWAFWERRGSLWKKKHEEMVGEGRRGGPKCVPADAFLCSTGMDWEGVGQRLDCPYHGLQLLTNLFTNTLWAVKAIMGARNRWIQKCEWLDGGVLESIAESSFTHTSSVWCWLSSGDSSGSMSQHITMAPFWMPGLLYSMVGPRSKYSTRNRESYVNPKGLVSEVTYHHFNHR